MLANRFLVANDPCRSALRSPEMSIDYKRRVVYVGIGGVLHPCATLYGIVHGCSPWDDGHQEYEGLPVLEAALEGWPDACIVLTSRQAWAEGLESVLLRLGSSLAKRVIGCTYKDLTSNARASVLGSRR